MKTMGQSFDSKTTISPMDSWAGQCEYLICQIFFYYTFCLIAFLLWDFGAFLMLSFLPPYLFLVTLRVPWAGKSTELLGVGTSGWISQKLLDMDDRKWALPFMLGIIRCTSSTSFMKIQTDLPV